MPLLIKAVTQAVSAHPEAQEKSQLQDIAVLSLNLQDFRTLFLNRMIGSAPDTTRKIKTSFFFPVSTSSKFY